MVNGRCGLRNHPRPSTAARANFYAELATRGRGTPTRSRLATAEADHSCSESEIDILLLGSLVQITASLCIQITASLCIHKSG